MKTIIAFILSFFMTLTLFSSLNELNAQNRFGFYLGGGMCKEGNSLYGTKFKTGFEAVGLYNMPLLEHLELRINAGYKLRGYGKDVVYWFSGPDYFVTTDYHLITIGPDLTFPVYNSKTTIYLLVGLRGNYLIDATGDMADGVEEYLDKFQVEADAGFGFRFEPGIFVEGIISGNCINKGNKSYEEDFRAYDFYIGLSLGYLIPLNDKK